MTEPKRLAELLPAIHLHRDAVLLEDGEYGRGPLEALLDVLQEHVDDVRADLFQLYDNWFVETAEDWVLPYIGDLIGVETTPSTTLTRARLTNTIRNRRRKGTLAVLEQLAADIGGWSSVAVEANNSLLRMPDIAARWQPVKPMPDIGNEVQAARIGTPFDSLCRMPESAGRYRPNTVAVHLWRVPVVSIPTSPAGRREEVNTRAFSFSMLGQPIALVVQPVPEHDSWAVASWDNAPSRITRGELKYDLSREQPELYGSGRGINVVCDGTPVPGDDIDVADLSAWDHRPAAGRIGLDPETGRIVVAPRRRVRSMEVSYTTAVDDLGGTPHPRPIDMPPGAVLRPPEMDIADLKDAMLASVGFDPLALHTADPEDLLEVAPLRYRVGPVSFPTIDAALVRWQDDRAMLGVLSPRRVRIEVEGNASYDAPDVIVVPAYTRLEIVGLGGAPLLWQADGSPVQDDSVTIQGDGPRSCFIMQDVVVAGRALTLDGHLDSFVMKRSTLVPGWTLDVDCRPVRPGEPSITVVSGCPCLRIERSILGPIDVALAEPGAPIEISAVESIIDAGVDTNEAIACRTAGIAHATLSLSGVLVLGTVLVHGVAAISDSIITGRFTVARRQVGCVRFSSFGAESRTPPHFETYFGLRVRFVSRRFGREGYGRLSLCADVRLRRGASDGGEMGAFGWLEEPARLDELERPIIDHSPAGARTGLFFADLEEL